MYRFALLNFRKVQELEGQISMEEEKRSEEELKQG